MVFPFPSARRFTKARRGVAALAGIGVALAGFAAAPAAHAADVSLTVDHASIRTSESLSITFDAGVAQAKNWVGIFADGAKPGGPASLDWRYVPEQSGTLSWGPSTRDGWTRNAGSIGAGSYDVYLLENDGYTVLAGPIDVTVTPGETQPEVPDAEPKPEVDGVSGLNVLTFNVWHGGTQVPDGAQQIADVITEVDADVTFLPEVGQAPAQVAALLGYQHLTATDTGIVSRYPIVSTGTVGRWWSKAVIDVNGTEVVVYGGHLEYRWYTTYLPRGYGGEVRGAEWPAGWDTWNRLGAPVTDVERILAANLQSGRPAAAAEVVADIAEERAAGRIAIVGGDFNEPPSQDWTAATAELQDHNGVVIPWQTTQTLLDGGLVDAFRAVHPDPVANPGITWPSDNPRFPTSSLTWAPEADERDRIDYIFATPDDRLTIDGSSVVGPQSSIVRDKRVDDDSADEIITPSAVWPSDHKAVLARFSICDDACGSIQPGQPLVQLDAASVVAGGAVSVAGTDFAPQTALRVELHSDPVVLGTVMTDADGAFRTVLTVPAATTAGVHSIVVVDSEGRETGAALTVTAAPTDGGQGGGGQGGGVVRPPTAGGSRSDALATTGADSSAAAIAALFLLGAGAAAITLRRRRSA